MTDRAIDAMARKQLVEAVAYFRTSSATNVGADKDSEKRQRAAIEAFAKRAGYALVDTFYDADVRGSDPVDVRPGFCGHAGPDRRQRTRTIIVETANRFSRDPNRPGDRASVPKGPGHQPDRGGLARDLRGGHADKRAHRQILGAVSQFEKASLVAKLKGARERKMKAQAAAGERVKCGGRRSYRELDGAMVDLARKLHRYPVNGRRRSLRGVSAELAAAGIARPPGGHSAPRRSGGCSLNR